MNKENYKAIFHDPDFQEELFKFLKKNLEARQYHYTPTSGVIYLFGKPLITY